MEAQKIAEKLLNHEERLKRLEDNAFTKQDQNRLFELLDKHTAILNRLDQDHSSMNNTIKRIQTDVESLQADMKFVKTKLAIR